MQYKLKSGRIITDIEWQQWINQSMSVKDIAQLLGVNERTFYRLKYYFKTGYTPMRSPENNIPQYRIYKTGQIITADQWRSWIKDNKSTEDIMLLLDIGQYTMANIRHKFREVGDLRLKPKPCETCGAPVEKRQARFCNKCAKLRATEAVKNHYHNTRAATIRIGDTGICKNCGKIYVITGSNQKRCIDCRAVKSKTKSQNIAELFDKLEKTVKKQDCMLANDILANLRPMVLSTTKGRKPKKSGPAEPMPAGYITAREWAVRNGLNPQRGSKLLTKNNKAVPGAMKVRNPHGGVDVWAVPEGTEWPY